MTRETLERHQVWLYLAAILAGLGLGTAAPGMAPVFEAVLWPTLGLLLYATFTQVPLNHLPRAFRDRRFMAAVLVVQIALLLDKGKKVDPLPTSPHPERQKASGPRHVCKKPFAGL